VPGTWSVSGAPMTCGADASFTAIPCGWGFGCSNGASAAFVLPGMSSVNQCADDKTLATSTAFSICDGKGGYGGWRIYVRAD